MTDKIKSNVMWGGRFEDGPDALMERINASINFDKRLYAQDIEGSRVHSIMLARQGIIDKKEADLICEGLSKILLEIESGEFEFKESLEDIHMNIESRLAEIIGDVAGKLHTARSRNDQVALDFRMWTRQQIDLCLKGLHEIIEAFINQAEHYGDLIMPGFTHLQVAQPVTWGHHMMAYVEMFGRDLERFHDARKRMNECPLGAAALAGTSFPIDRYYTSDNLGFDRPTANSLDSTSDRDFALEFLSASAICATHLSRFSEELVIWSSSQFGFVNISERFSSGSSIMPQKKNPDAAELIRAKGSRINGSLIALLTTMKGLPLTYSKDMQEDKEQVFDAADTLLLSLAAMSGMLRELTPNKEILENAASKGFSTATDLADWLVKNINIPFREAHKITGQIVKIAERNGCDLSDLSLGELQEVNQFINKGVYSVLGIKNSVNSRDSYGGTSPKEVKKQIVNWKKKMQNEID
mgnify:CR=1 FL=1